MATLTYVYAESTVVLGPLALQAEPHTYDFCAEHSERFTAPRGWEVVRLALPDTAQQVERDDVYALADALHQAQKRDADTVDRLSPRRTRERLGGEDAPPPAKPGLHLVPHPDGARDSQPDTTGDHGAQDRGSD